MSQSIYGRRVIAPEFGTSAAGRNWGRTIIAANFDGYTRLVHIFTTQPSSIEALRRLGRGDTLAANGEVVESGYQTRDGRREKLYRINFATGLNVQKKRSKR